MKYKNINFKILFAVFSVSAFIFFSCKQNNISKTQTEDLNNLKITFSVDGSGGKLIAKIGTKIITSPVRVKKGSIIVFEAVPDFMYETEVWKGAVKSVSDKNKASLRVISGTEVKVKFKKKENTNPPIEEKEVSVFTINGIGKIGLKNNIFSPEFYNHLTDGTKPVFSFDGNDVGKAEIKIGCQELSGKCAFKKVKFYVEGKIPKEVSCTKVTDGIFTDWIALYSDKFTAGKEYFIKIEIMPLEIGKYSPLVFEFKIVNSGKKPDLPVNFFIDGKRRYSGFKTLEPIKTELTELAVETNDDCIKEVYINEEKCKIEKLEVYGDSVWFTEKIVQLPTSGIHKEFRIRLEPKDLEKYKTTVCIFKLTGTRESANNTDFDVSYGFNPSHKVFADVSFYSEKPAGTPKYINFLGTKTAKISACTVNPRAKVHYKIVDIAGTTIGTEGVLTNKGSGFHEMEYSQTINLFTDKTTIVIVYVEAEDGTKAIDLPDGNKEEKLKKMRGIKELSFNPVRIRWDYTCHSQGMEYPQEKEVYDKIFIKKTELQADKKIHIAFLVWKEDFFTVDGAYSYPAHQGVPVKLEAHGNNMQWYETEADTSALDGNTITELELTLPFKEKEVPCFNYKLKVKISE